MSRIGGLLLLACALSLPASLAVAGPVKTVGAGGGSALPCSCEPDADAPGQGQCVEIDPGALCSSLVTCDTAADCSMPDEEVCVASFALACGSENKCLPRCPEGSGLCVGPSQDPSTLTACAFYPVPALGGLGAVLLGGLLLTARWFARRRGGRAGPGARAVGLPPPGR